MSLSQPLEPTQPCSSVRVPLLLKHNCERLLNCKINDLPFSVTNKLYSCLDGRPNAIRAIAATIEHSGLTEVDISRILRSERPGEKLLHKLGSLNKTLNDLLMYLQKVDFWEGLECFYEPFGPLILQATPASIRLDSGQSLQLTCKAAGIPAPTFQWFYLPKSAEPCKIPGESDKATLEIQDPQYLDGCPILCSVDNGRLQKLTKPCIVHSPPAHFIDPQPSPPDPECSVYAKDKVALLIGNEGYMSDKKLSAPSNDILKVGNKLRAMKFKTLICKDLTKAHMEKVIDFFISLLYDGVYGVLYFAGHGFEVHRSPFLVPSDSPTQSSPETSISAWSVINKIQKREPALCLVMLDICRVRVDGSSANVDIPECNNNTMVVYSTGEGQKAFEFASGERPHSIFAINLLKYIDEPVSLSTLMIEKVLPSMKSDAAASKYQMRPTITTTLATNRSLKDKIDPSGATRKFKNVEYEWARVTTLPPQQEFPFPELGIEVRVLFSFDYSNVLIIHTACLQIDRTVAYGASARVSHAFSSRQHVDGSSNKVDKKSKWPANLRGNNKCLSVYKTEINGLESLEFDLKVDMNVEGVNQHKEPFSRKVEMNLHKPLIASLSGRGREGLPTSLSNSSLRPSRLPEENEESTAIEHDESLINPVPPQSFLYSQPFGSTSRIPEESDCTGYKQPGSCPV